MGFLDDINPFKKKKKGGGGHGGSIFGAITGSNALGGKSPSLAAALGEDTIGKYSRGEKSSPGYLGDLFGLNKTNSKGTHLDRGDGTKTPTGNSFNAVQKEILGTIGLSQETKDELVGLTQKKGSNKFVKGQLASIISGDDANPLRRRENLRLRVEILRDRPGRGGLMGGV